MRTVKIYMLIDPIDNIPKYIGKTVTDINKRYNSHIYQWTRDKGRHNKLNSWIKSLAKKGYKPIIEIIDNCDENNWQLYEMSYIKLFKSFGANLKNSTNGGDEAPKNCNSNEAKQKRIKTLETSESWKLGHLSRTFNCLVSRIYKLENPDILLNLNTRQKG